MPLGLPSPPMGKGTGLVTLPSAPSQALPGEWAPLIPLRRCCPRQAADKGQPLAVTSAAEAERPFTCLSLRADLGSSHPSDTWRNGSGELFTDLLGFTAKPEVSQASEEEFSLSIRYVRGTLCFLPKCNPPQDVLTRKKVGFPCSGLNGGTSFISHDVRLSLSTAVNLGNALGLWVI